MKIYIYILSIACLCIQQNINADPIITLFIRPYPGDQAFAQEMANRLQNGKKFAKRQLYCIANQCAQAGVIATYAGYLRVSNSSGQIIFPRKHEQPLIYLIVTDKLVPITMIANTVHHLQFDPSADVALYKVEQKYDEQINQYYWDVTTIKKTSDIVPLEALVIISKPKNVIVPTGVTLTTESPNLILPDIYIKKDVNPINNALYMLNLAHLFSQASVKYKQEAKRYLQQITGG